MSRPPRWRTRGFGYPRKVVIDPRLDKWIKRHLSFAHKGWIISKVKYGEWIWQPDGSFNVYVKVPQQRKTLTIVLKCRHFPLGGPHSSERDYVHVFGSHVSRKKPR